MPTAKQLRRMAERRGFSRDQTRKSAIIYDGSFGTTLKIESRSDGGYAAAYMGRDYRITNGEFGPKGGAKNYGARKIVREFSD